jgi:hypothetical protein
MVSNRTLETLIWLLIYGGLLVLCLAAFLRRSGAALGWVLMLMGGAAVLLGVVLVWIRSRRPR